MLAAITIAVLGAQAVPPPQPDAKGDVVVVGSREAHKINMREFRAAQSEFAGQRSRYAPNAALRFLLKRSGSTTFSKPFQLQLSDGSRKVPIAVDADGSFELPSEPPGNWWLEANFTRKQVWLSALTRSPGMTRIDYRLGDARLECRVLWAMAKADASVLAAPLIGLADLSGPCTNRKIGIYVTAPGSIRTADLEEGGRTEPIQVTKSRRSYRLPADESAFSNEARVRIATD